MGNPDRTGGRGGPRLRSSPRCRRTPCLRRPHTAASPALRPPEKWPAVVWAWVKNRYPKWLALANGNKNQNLRSPWWLDFDPDQFEGTRFWTVQNGGLANPHP